MPLPYYFDNCSVVISSEVRKPVPPSLFFSLQIVLSILGFLHLYRNLKKKKTVCSSSIKSVVGIRLELHWICRFPRVVFWQYWFFLPENMIHLSICLCHLFDDFLHQHLVVFRVQVFVSLGKFITFDAEVNRISFLNFSFWSVVDSV